MDNRTIDAAVAEHVMGWRRNSSGWIMPDVAFPLPMDEPPAYSTHPTAMMKVVEKMRGDGYLIVWEFHEDRDTCLVMPPDGDSPFTANAPKGEMGRAFTTAALLAHGVEVQSP